MCACVFVSPSFQTPRLRAAALIRTEIQGASISRSPSHPSPPPLVPPHLPSRPFRQDAVPLANSDCSHGGDARGGEAVQSVAMATYRHWTPFTPHFTYVSIPIHGDPAAGQHRPIPSQKHWSLITQLSP